MRVLVLGSGVIGTASAYYLARAGFEVVVVDRQNGPPLQYTRPQTKPPIAIPAATRPISSRISLRPIARLP